MVLRCALLEVQGLEMRQSDSEKYIGDFISSIDKIRESQGIGELSQIFSMLEAVSLVYS